MEEINMKINENLLKEDAEENTIIVGEQRDFKEYSIEEYIKFSNTGHLVFTTTASCNAVEIYKRLKELGIKE